MKGTISEDDGALSIYRTGSEERREKRRESSSPKVDRQAPAGNRPRRHPETVGEMKRLPDLINFIRFLILCARTYRACDPDSVREPVCYSAVVYCGVPATAIFVARGRAAWRVTQFAINERFLQ